ncbi:MAG: putative unusual protein kinase regulating ubiquinone biosynthesis (AarF/ABC1/UbiB family) [Pseudomonadales bacterium]|jgi:predicted unusual protein kinase regulating ubiquinone biosynthesis (AarF/ABC1/UbiB family)
MKEKLTRIKSKRLERRLSVSIAGLRAGGAIALGRSTDWLLKADERKSKRKVVLAKEAKRFASELGKLKGSYVKIGQMLALFGEHLLPKELTAALHELEHQTVALDWPIIETALTEELGDILGELMIEPEPLACASIGQVHRAKIIATGEEICLKVQYPGVEETIDSDFSDVVAMLKLANWLKTSRNLDLLLEDIRKLLHEETDYQREAVMTVNMANLLKGDKRFQVPAVHQRFSTKKIIALEFIEGFEVTASNVQELPLARRNKLAKAMLDLLMKEIFEWGVLQTDPNFGNYRIKSSSKSDKLVLLDFGAVRAFDNSFLNPLRATITGAYHNDKAAVVQGVIDLKCIDGCHPKSVQESFAEFCMGLLEPLREDFDGVSSDWINEQGEYCWAKSTLIRRAAKQAAKSSFSLHFTVPPQEFALIARKLTGVFTFIVVLDAEFNGHDILKSYVDNWEQNSY